MNAVPSRERRLRSVAIAATVGVTASLGLLAPTLGSPANAAPPAEDCTEAFPVSELVTDQVVNGLTVSKGTTPEAFTGTVLGVLDDGIGVGRDMIMMELSSPAIDKAKGIWQGMSGSPVYAEDGRLIGAVAYGLAWGSTPIAGITPFEYMDDYLGPAAVPGRVQVSDKEARRIAATGEVTQAQAANGFVQLVKGYGVSGVSAERFASARQRNKAYTKGAGYAGGAGTGAAADATEDTLIAGGSLAAVLSTGDITMAGVGTVTSVCGGQVVGFGHPMDAAGPTAYAMAAADVITVQSDPLGVPYKLSNVGQIAGTIAQDRLSGIAGPLGEAPTPGSFTSDVTFNGVQRVGTTDVYVPDAMAAISFYGSLGNHDAVIDYYTPGTETQDWLIEGTDAAGEPFSIAYSDMYTSSDIAYAPQFYLADTVWVLGMVGATVTDVTNVAVGTDNDDVHRVKRIEQKVDGAWKNVTTTKIKAKAGQTVKLRITVVASDGSTTVLPYAFAVPNKMTKGRGYVEFGGGGSDYLDIYGAKTVEGVIDALEADAANNSVSGTVKVKGSNLKIAKSYESELFDMVVLGRKYIPVVVGTAGADECAGTIRGC